MWSPLWGWQPGPGARGRALAMVRVGRWLLPLGVLLLAASTWVAPVAGALAALGFAAALAGAAALLPGLHTLARVGTPRERVRAGVGFLLLVAGLAVGLFAFLALPPGAP